MADFYRVKNGNWDLANSWATTSGGTTYHAAPPTSSDNVYFDANTPTGTHTLNNFSSNCNNIDFTGFSGTITGYFSLYISGNATWSNTMTNNFTGSIYIYGNCEFTTNGLQFSSIIYIQLSSSTLKLMDGLTFTGKGGLALTDASATFNANSQTVTASIDEYFYITGSGEFTGTNSFYDLEILSDGAPARIKIDTNITISNSLTITGTEDNFVNIYTLSDDGEVDITSESNTISYCNFAGIVGKGNASWDFSSVSTIGDGGGNTDLSFVEAVTSYWVKNGGNINDHTKLKTTSGGATDSRAALAHDTIIFDSNSFDTNGQTIATNGAVLCNIVFDGVTNSPTLSGYVYLMGNLTLDTNMTFSPTVDIASYAGDEIDIDPKGKAIAPSNTIIQYNKYYNFIGGFDISGYLSVTKGSVKLMGDNYTMEGLVSTGSLNRTLTLGTGTITIDGNMSLNQQFRLEGTNLTFNCGTSTIKFTGAMSSNQTWSLKNANWTFYNIEINNTGGYVVTIGDSTIPSYITFNSLKIANTVGGVYFYQGKTFKFGSFEAEGQVGDLIEIKSSSSSVSATLEKTGGGVVSCDYIDAQRLSGTPDNTWYMGENSTDSGNNSQIYFTEPILVETIEKDLDYTVLTDTTIQKDLDYVITSDISIEKTLQYCVNSTVSPIQKDLDYYILIEPSPIEKELEYMILNEIPIQKDLKYTVITEPSAIEKGLDYYVTITPSAIEKTLDYNIVTDNNIQKSLDYAILSDTGIQKTLDYTVATENNIQKTLDYTITTDSAIQKTLDYYIVIDTNIQKTLDYKVLTDTAVQKDLDYYITIDSAINKTLSYTIKSGNSLSKDLDYTILTTPSPIQKDLDYELNPAVVIEKDLDYCVLTDSVIEKDLDYTLLTENTISKGLDYRVETDTSISKTLDYNILTSDTISKELDYKILAENNINKTLQYIVVENVAINKELEYRIIIPETISKTLSYEILNENAITKSLQYIVASPVTITKTLRICMKSYPYTKQSSPYTKQSSPYTRYPK